MTTARLTPERTRADSSAKEHIVRTPGTCFGKPRVAGTRIKVSTVFELHERQGRSASQIVGDNPHLTLADVYAALAYAHDHREEIEAEIEREVRTVEAWMAERPSLLQSIAAKRPDVTKLSNAAAAAYVESGLCPTEDLLTLKAMLSALPNDEDFPALTEALTRV